nr:uncharacterized protein LOC122270958 isoform X2 [Parasteatoda tepidariorum]
MAKRQRSDSFSSESNLFVDADDWSSRTLFKDDDITLSDSDDYLFRGNLTQSFLDASQEIQRIDTFDDVEQHGSGLQVNIFLTRFKCLFLYTFIYYVFF